MNFYTPQHDEIRQQILSDKSFRDHNLKNYSKFINAAIKELPSVHHYSWFDIERKISGKTNSKLIIFNYPYY